MSIISTTRPSKHPIATWSQQLNASSMGIASCRISQSVEAINKKFKDEEKKRFSFFHFLNDVIIRKQKKMKIFLTIEKERLSQLTIWIISIAVRASSTVVQFISSSGAPAHP